VNGVDGAGVDERDFVREHFMQQTPSILWALALTGAALFGGAVWLERHHWLNAFRGWRLRAPRRPA
jgi:hypothetical protein